MFSGFREHLLESLQVKLAYLFRRSKALRLKQELEEQRRIEEAKAEARRQAAREKKLRQRQLEKQR